MCRLDIGPVMCIGSDPGGMRKQPYSASCEGWSMPPAQSGSYPLPMIERIIKMASNSDDIVLDPFLGSGTTLVAAKKLGRRGIGFELDEK